MSDIVRRRTRAQGDQELVHRQSGFMGGLSTNHPPSSISSTELPELDNLVPLRSGLRTRPGSRLLKHSTTAEHIAEAVFQLSSGQILTFHGSPKRIRSQYFSNGDLSLTGVPTLCLDTAAIPFTITGMDLKFVEHGNYLYVLAGTDLYSVQLSNNGVLSTGATFVKLTGRDVLAACPAMGTVFDPGTLLRYRCLTVPVQKDNSGNILHMGAPISLADYSGVYQEVNTERVAGYQQPLWFDWAASATLLSTLSASGYTHVQMYRTKELNGQYVTGPDATDATKTTVLINTPAANPEQFWLYGTYEIATTVTTWITNPSIGAPFDEYLVEPLTTRFRRHLNAVSDFAVTNGLLWMVDSSQKSKLAYSPIGAGQYMAGLYFPGAQEVDLPQRVTHLFRGADYLGIACSNSTHIVRPDTQVNLGDATKGEYIPLLVNPPQEIDPSIGIMDNGACHLKSGVLTARTSDGWLRQFNGTWSVNLLQNTLSTEVQALPNIGQMLVVNSEGVIYLWAGYNSSTEQPTHLYRVARDEDNGVGACRVTGEGFPLPKIKNTARVDRAFPLYDDFGRERLCITSNVLGSYLYEIEVDDLWRDEVYSPGVGAAGILFTPGFSTREITGTALNHNVEHARTDIFVHALPNMPVPGPVKASFKLYEDGETDHSQEIPLLGQFAVFSGGKPCSRFRVRVDFQIEYGPFFVPEFAVQFTSRHERNLEESTSLNDAERLIGKCDLGLMSRGNTLHPGVLWEYSGAQQPYRGGGGVVTEYDTVTLTGNLGTSPISQYFTVACCVVPPTVAVGMVAGWYWITIGRNSVGVYDVATMTQLADYPQLRNASRLCVGVARTSDGYYQMYFSDGENYVQEIFSDSYPGDISQTSLQATGSSLSVEDLRMCSNTWQFTTFEAYAKDILQSRYNFFPSPRRTP